MTPSPTRDALTRRRALGGLGAAGLALTLLHYGIEVSAQEATPVPRDGHPIIGVWQGNPDRGNPLDVLPISLYAPNGAYVEYGIGYADGDRPTVGIGAWRPTGELTAEVVFVDQSIFAIEPILVLDQPLPANLLEGNAPRIRRTIEVDESGNRYKSKQRWVDENGKEMNPTFTAGGAYRLVAAPGV